ncbi:translational repressor RegA [Candidatus Dojkabacteria bacterium]|jgi:hypothetical protein|nr:translational repressor RegA [Candidatus Dojkabacteria bacterium]
MTDLNKFIEVSLTEHDDFLKVKETLTRIGVSSRKEKILYQSCHILHKQGKYYLVHFKELFDLDGKPTDITENDIQRRNSIAKLLQEWGLFKILTPKTFSDRDLAPIHQIKIIPFKDKLNWTLVAKYNIGKKIINVL